MLYIQAKPGDRIILGREGENLARTIRFNISHWKALYGDVAVSLLHQRDGDDSPYPCAITVVGSVVEWIITNADTAKVGQYGKYELQCRVGDTLAKSASGNTIVFDALGESTEEPPEAQQGWVDRVLDAANRAEDAASRAEEFVSGTLDHRKLTNRDAADQHPMSAIAGLEVALSDKQPAGDYLLSKELPAAVDNALAKAKASGEFDGKDGKDGNPGKDGADGIGIRSVTQTTTSNADGGTNIITVTKTDGSTSTFSVKNGSKGSDGQPGKDGQNGAPGRTPVKGTDYWTAADKAAMVSDVLAALPPSTGGADGKDGVTFYPDVDADGNLSWTNNGGLSNPDPVNIKGPAGADGQPGKDGADGVGIRSVEQTTTSTEDGGENIITVTKTDGTQSTFAVKNGSKGSDGQPGQNGADGKTPVKGTDYWTAADKAAMVNDVLAALPTWTGGSY